MALSSPRSTKVYMRSPLPFLVPQSTVLQGYERVGRASMAASRMHNVCHCHLIIDRVSPVNDTRILQPIKCIQNHDIEITWKPNPETEMEMGSIPWALALVGKPSSNFRPLTLPSSHKRERSNLGIIELCTSKIKINKRLSILGELSSQNFSGSYERFIGPQKSCYATGIYTFRNYAACAGTKLQSCRKHACRLGNKEQL